MVGERKLIIGIMFFLFVNISYATVDYLVINHTTKQLYWADDDNREGFIGWESLPYSELNPELVYLNKGYRFTKFPYKIELWGFIILGITLFLFFRIKEKKDYENILD